MLSDDIKRYVDLHRAVGFKYHNQARVLRSFCRYAAAHGEARLQVQTVITWAGQAPSPASRRGRLAVVRRFALHMQAEDPGHEVPPALVFGRQQQERRMPHIYTDAELLRLLTAASELTPHGSLRPTTFVALFSTLAATGLRISEALSLKVDNVTTDGLVILSTKFRKSRLVPLHPTARSGLERYLAVRRRHGAADRAVFVSLRGTQMRYETAVSGFRSAAVTAGLRPDRGAGGPCMHDLRHTFAVRSLEQCAHNSADVRRHMVALSTYLGHAHVSDTYWYLQATPMLMHGIARVGEQLFEGGRS